VIIVKSSPTSLIIYFIQSISMERLGFGGFEPSHLSTQVPKQDTRFGAFFLRVQTIFSHPVFQDSTQPNHDVLAALKSEFEQALQQFEVPQQADHLRGALQNDFGAHQSFSQASSFPLPYPDFDSSEFDQLSSQGSKNSK